MTASSLSAYTHTQRGVWHWVLLFVCVAIVVLAFVASQETPWALLALFLPVIFGFLAVCFAQLTVRDRGAELEVVFGPLEVFKRRIPYAEVESAEPDRTVLLEGWGIHYIPGRGGWVWNIHGFDCVRITYRDGSLIRVGTDDPAGLAAFVQSRLPR